MSPKITEINNLSYISTGTFHMLMQRPLPKSNSSIQCIQNCIQWARWLGCQYITDRKPISERETGPSGARKQLTKSQQVEAIGKGLGLGTTPKTKDIRLWSGLWDGIKI